MNLFEVLFLQVSFQRNGSLKENCIAVFLSEISNSAIFRLYSHCSYHLNSLRESKTILSGFVLILSIAKTVSEEFREVVSSLISTLKVAVSTVDRIKTVSLSQKFTCASKIYPFFPFFNFHSLRQLAAPLHLGAGEGVRPLPDGHTGP